MDNNERMKIYKDMMADSKVLDEVNSLPQPKSLEEMARVLGGLSDKNGYDLSEKDFDEIFRELQERSDQAAASASLSDSELLSVSGGSCRSNPIIFEPDESIPLSECEEQETTTLDFNKIPKACGYQNMNQVLGGGLSFPPKEVDVSLQ